MRRSFDLTVTFGLCVETDRGDLFTLASKFTVLPKRRHFWRTLKDSLDQISRMVLNALVPCPAYLAG